jgi:hypothetical protein
MFVISGGQTGVDQAALRAARRAGLKTGGWAPYGWKTEDGPERKLLQSYGLQEHPSRNYPDRTRANADMADGTLWLGSGDTNGYWCTHNACRTYKKPFLAIVEFTDEEADKASEWIAQKSIKTLNVAGNRESSSPGIGDKAEAWLYRLFTGEPECTSTTSLECSTNISSEERPGDGTT